MNRIYIMRKRIVDRSKPSDILGMTKKMLYPAESFFLVIGNDGHQS